MPNVKCQMSNEGRKLLDNKKFLHWSLVIGLLVITAAGGCGERIESTSYYYTPGWTQAGDVIFVKGLQSVKKDAIGTQIGSTYTETLMTMSAAGANETSRFDASGAPPYSMSGSPTRNYVAYMGDLRNDMFGKIVIRNISTEAYTGMREAEILFSPTQIKSFDWSNDGNRIVYCTTQEVRIRNWNDFNGTTDTTVEVGLTNVRFVSWKYGGRIAFVHGSPEVLSLIYADRTGRVNLTDQAFVNKPQISSANTNEVYGIAGGSYCKVDVSAGTPATTEVLTNFSGKLPRLSPDASKVVYDKSGESSGIYILDIAAKAETKIK